METTIFVMAEGLGKVVIQGRKCNTIVFHDVLYIPPVKSNMLSVGQLVERGSSFKVDDARLNLYEQKYRLVLKAPLA